MVVNVLVWSQEKFLIYIELGIFLLLLYLEKESRGGELGRFEYHHQLQIDWCGRDACYALLRRLLSR